MSETTPNPALLALEEAVSAILNSPTATAEEKAEELAARLLTASALVLRRDERIRELAAELETREAVNAKALAALAASEELRRRSDEGTATLNTENRKLRRELAATGAELDKAKEALQEKSALLGDFIPLVERLRVHTADPKLIAEVDDRVSAAKGIRHRSIPSAGGAEPLL